MTIWQDAEKRRRTLNREGVSREAAKIAKITLFCDFAT
jgi:hypothetical protein